ncbi:hypothetical protein R3P38DRAFT_2872145 [Favolaschia claudopus]|uniref:Uncharacterized protein n=1 Tax=Favolaschia claudopus TaxID=2862362 RepID=A0AAW0DC63_9AGAR
MASPPGPPSSPSSSFGASQVDEGLITDARKDILASWYLGVSKVLDEAVWREVRPGEKKLFAPESVEAADKEAERVALIESSQSRRDVGKHPASHWQPKINEGLLVPVYLTFVAKISADGFWLMPDGNWRATNKVVTQFSKVKLNCKLVRPPMALSSFANEWVDMWYNLEKILATAAADQPPHARESVLSDVPEEWIKLRHVLFEKLEREATVEELTALENWPVNSNEATAALKEMKNDKKFRVVPIPVYDKPGGKRIPPSRYVSDLKGAVVEVNMVLTYWDIPPSERKPRIQAFTADIHRMAVLVPPPKRPNKRVISEVDPGSPKKPRRAY